ncbi:MAG: exopolysaccharide biosynthesis polyprenyl glycosylphosphotransferase [Planctomycetota bacterium]
MLGPLPRIKSTRPWFTAGYRALDALCILVSLFWAQRYGQRLQPDQFVAIAASSIIAFSLASELTHNYRRWRGSRFRFELICVWGTWAMTAVMLVVFGALTQYGSGLTRFSYLVWVGFGTLSFGMVRSVLRGLEALLLVRGIGTKGYAIVGINPLAFELARNIRNAPHLGLELNGFFDDRPQDRVPEIPQDMGQRLGTIEDLVQACQAGEVSLVYITFPMRAEDRIREVLNALADSTASVYVVPDLFVFEMLHARMHNIGGIPVVSIFENPLYGVDGVLKRGFDLVAATMALAVATLPMLVIAMLIKWTSPGPIFFRQRRYGLDGREIRVWKFRSMTVAEDADVVTQATKHDQRVTPLGRFLRRTSLDELPQLFNVLAGQMSLVGPRPHATAHNETYRKSIRSM